MSFVDEITGSLQKMLSVFPYSGKVVEDKQLVEALFVFHASRDVQALMAGL